MKLSDMKPGQWFWNHRAMRPFLRTTINGTINCVSLSGVLMNLPDEDYQLLRFSDLGGYNG